MSKLIPGWQNPGVLEAVFDQLSDALVLYDPDFKITGVNHAAEKLFGMTSEEMLGKNCQEVFKCSMCMAECGVLESFGPTPEVPCTQPSSITATAQNVWW